MKRLRQYTHTLSSKTDSPADPVAEASNLPWVRHWGFSLSCYRNLMFFGSFLTIFIGAKWNDFIGSVFFTFIFFVALALDRYIFIPKMVPPIKPLGSTQDISIFGYPLSKLHKFMSWHIQSRPLFFLPLLGIDLIVNAFSIFGESSFVVFKLCLFVVILLRQLIGYMKFGVCDLLIKFFNDGATGRIHSSNPHNDLHSPTNPSGLLNSSSPNYIHRP